MISRMTTAHSHQPARHLVRHGLLVVALLCSVYSVQVGRPAATARMAGALVPCGGVCGETTGAGAQTAV